MKTKKKNKGVNTLWILLFLLIIVIIFIVVFVYNKAREKRELEKKINSFNERINAIEISYARRIQMFNWAYLAFRIILFLGTIAVCVFTIMVNDSPDFFVHLSNCVTVFAALGILLLGICFFTENDPKSIFHLRAIIKDKLKNFLIEPVKKDVDSLPILVNEKDNLEQRLIKVNSELE